LGLLGAAASDLKRLAQGLAVGEQPAADSEAKNDRDIDAALAVFREAATAILQALGKRL
jgi:hypothetical protein